MNKITAPTVPPVEAVLNSLVHAAHAFEERADRALRAVELSMPKLGVLSVIAQAGRPLALSELAERLACVRSNMTQLVDRLEADGLVRRVPDPEDRRSVRAELTSLGEERQAEGAKQLAAVQAEVAGALSEPERAGLFHALSVLK